MICRHAWKNQHLTVCARTADNWHASTFPSKTAQCAIVPTTNTQVCVFYRYKKIYFESIWNKENLQNIMLLFIYITLFSSVFKNFLNFYRLEWTFIHLPLRLPDVAEIFPLLPPAQRHALRNERKLRRLNKLPSLLHFLNKTKIIRRFLQV